MSEQDFIVIKNWMASHDAISKSERREWTMRVLSLVD